MTEAPRESASPAPPAGQDLAETETGSYVQAPGAAPPAAPRGIALILLVIGILLLWALLSR